ncbi:nuclear transport factor 2 family protein [Streptomyces sp. YC537]|uniref:Nuclear transport factor 2 family protein n=1 Tax=Streptomyces boluensis TaxID=1775135 RepID=A0A964XKP2_9ACTN|nr:nuclear transport factor 2 family protein [Streptomyces boluensis]
MAPPSAEAFVTGLFGVIDGRRWEELGRVFTDDCTYQRPGYAPFVGLRRVERFYREERLIASGRHEVHQVVAEGSSIVCRGRFRGLSRTGVPLDEGFCDLYSLAGDRIRTRHTYFFRAAI